MTPEETERCRQVLLPAEEVVRVARPRTQMPVVVAGFRVIAGLVLLGGLAYMASQTVPIWWLILLVSLPFILLAVALIISPLLHRRRREGTLYLLTNRRVLVLDPGMLTGSRVVAYPLQPNPVREVHRYADGYEDIVFTYEMRWQLNGHLHRGPMPVGFIDVAVEYEMSAAVAAQVADTPASVPGPAAQPPTVAGLPVETDSWGNPVSVNPQRGVLMGIGAAFAAFAAIFLVIGIVQLRKELQFEREAVRTTATVEQVRTVEHVSRSDDRRRHRHHDSGVRIRINENRESRVSYTYYPLLRFTDMRGREHRFESQTGSSDYNFPEGQQVPVMYLPRNPAEVRLCDDSPGVGLIFTMVGGFGLVIGGGILAGGFMMKR